MNYNDDYNDVVWEKHQPGGREKQTKLKQVFGLLHLSLGILQRDLRAGDFSQVFSQSGNSFTASSFLWCRVWVLILQPALTLLKTDHRILPLRVCADFVGWVQSPRVQGKAAT